MNDFSVLSNLIKTLRSPEGCPWDRTQKKADLGKYLINEAYEVLDAIESGDKIAFREELGDLLFQIVFLAVLAEEEGEFTLEEVVSHVKEKMVRRHPHVFGERAVDGVEEVKKNWELMKMEEGKSLLNGTPRSLPALRRAQEITKRAARVGFDWPQIEGLWKKMDEELDELKQALAAQDKDKVELEVGDLLFTCVNLARFLQVEAEEALRNTTDRFVERFSYIEDRLKAKGKKLEEATLEEMDALWEEAKGK
ncbi:MAG: nucleoside triphosphate pyrophosphohydrolase [Syntrophales bacterium]|nr:nucleoside triphosphate pyrophosphohydrolase [Syntrophales bacterium]